jgi:AAHS family 4-hydroxybenzoate transporter-like MFS transporter
MAIGAPTGGWLGDRYGRKPAVLLSGALFALCTALTAIVSNVEMLTLARLACGLGLGAAAANALALATEWLPQRWHARAVSILAIGVPGGGMLGVVGCNRVGGRLGGPAPGPEGGARLTAPPGSGTEAGGTGGGRSEKSCACAAFWPRV